MKKILCIINIFILAFACSSCAAEKAVQQNNTTTSASTYSDATTSAVFTTQAETTATEASTTEAQATNTTAVTTEITTQKLLSTAEIISKYKAAATASDVRLQQNISLTDISVNNGEGGINSVLSFIKPIISSVVSGNSSEIDGITGGYSQLVESDLQTAEAYSKGNKTIIKLIPKEQNDAKIVDEHHGSVGHLISVVGGNINDVLKQMSESGLPIEISTENISAVYTQPSANVTVNANGVIENGTWRYTVTITLSDFKVSGTTVSNACVTMDNVLTLNGGFSE